MRCILVVNINEFTPLIDFYFAMHSLTRELKNIVLLDDPLVTGLNGKALLAEYKDHISAKKAIGILNSLQSSEEKVKIISNSILSLKASWSLPLVDNVNELLKSTPFCFFENLPVDNYDPKEFKNCLEKHLNNVSVKRLRLYSTKILVQFNQNIPLSLLSSPFYFKDKLIPVIPAMRPSLNAGKYKDRSVRASIYFMTAKDRASILDAFMEENVDDSYKKKADLLYNKLITEERRKEKESSSFSSSKREREIVDDYHNYNYEKKRDRRDKRERSEEITKGTSSGSTYNLPVNNISSSNNNQINSNLLSQLTSLLINNPNSSNIISSLQNLSMLGNLQNLQSIISNPCMLTILQQLVNNSTNQTNSNVNVSNQNLKTNYQIDTQSIPNQIPSQSKIQYPNQPQNFTSSTQINPIYNMPKPNNVEPQQIQSQNVSSFKNFYPNHLNPSPNQNFPYQMGMNQIQDIYANQAFMNMQMDYGMSFNQLDTDNNLMMKKYYEYYQNINNNK